MITTVLIANRGAIATRIIRTLKALGLKSVAVYAEADRDSLHVQQADQAFSLGEGAAATTYLDQDKLFAIANQAGADAIHPGYGFLSENPDFVRRCEQSDICFLGPTPTQMEAFGLKHSARELAEQNGVPLVPGTDLLTSLDEAVAAADQIGYPVMLKSTAGGGGIGMQLCEDKDTLLQAYDSVIRLSQNNFGNAGVFLEKYIQTARHVEVQVFGDGAGHVVTLGARDCSLQRRNQKVVEETPPPCLPAATQAQMEATAERLMSAIAYRSAGTVEYIYDVSDGQYYFLEVNTRLQVEHGVTEAIFDVDIVAWMVKLGQQTLPSLPELAAGLSAKGHAIQVRLYAEDPNKDFQPCAGTLSQVSWPDIPELRVDHWLSAGQSVSPFFDPMLAKVIVHGDDRADAIAKLQAALAASHIYGIETNLSYLQQVLANADVNAGKVHTRLLNSFNYQPLSIDVLMAGTMTTIQDFPARQGYWDVGVPPSGPFDDRSFQLGNRLLGNDKTAAGLEITLSGPTLRFNCDRQLVLTGAEIEAQLNGAPIAMWQVIDVRAGDTLQLGKVAQSGSRSYLLVAGGIDCPDYLGSKSTFTLGQFGGHNGRALQVGDTLHLCAAVPDASQTSTELVNELKPKVGNSWTLHVIYGPHGAPDFFTAEDIEMFFGSDWEVHYNSSRTGVRLVGPKPQWARRDGGEAGMHPSNIHDNAYAIGTIDFTGDMPVILGPDGPSLGGFVCPATVIAADRWKLGQLRAGDKLRFVPVSIEQAVAAEQAQQQMLDTLTPQEFLFSPCLPTTPIVKTLSQDDVGIDVVYRPSGDKYLLVEYGELVLDIELRFRVHALMLWLQENSLAGLKELTPGIRSLQIHYDSLTLSLTELLAHLEYAERSLTDLESMELPSRIVHLPLSWDDEACRLAIEKYMQSVRHDAPWCPSNIEFIRRINGLDDIEQVKQIVFDASYLVMGLGDVYLGAPVATPLDPRHRLVTTKYNPARTWTAENSVGIGGAYMCVYGMEGPGGYQFVGRTCQMWNKLFSEANSSKEFSKPWLLRFFDQIRFYPVSADELKQIREDFPKGRYPLKIEQTSFSLKGYKQFLADNSSEIDTFVTARDAAFDEELQRWEASGQINFESSQDLDVAEGSDDCMPDNCVPIDSHVAGSVWQMMVAEGDTVEAGQTLAILESMKMEIQVTAPIAGIVNSLRRKQGAQINAGQSLIWLQESSS
ncbi:urea carboxylase [Corallincola spongiicola]|uniref:Urea carboxylase n=1 Tax=Corallincola spongiicola TaxID=2520508 RepID=A0ABY1WMQ0_9GAMM|nr:urea carboxylase [Corallincola spongiicola]TAA43695.1 urea carboxylase [Corallincola spongiicola]